MQLMSILHESPNSTASFRTIT